MTIYVWTDNASSTLASGITNVATSCVLQTGQGALFPSIGAGQAAIVTLEDTSGNIETVLATGRTGDTLTIVRGQFGTTALAFASGSRVEVRPNAGSFQSFLQKNGGDTLAGTTTLAGVIAMGGGGSITGGEYAGGFVRSAAGVTAGQIWVSGGVPKSGTDTLLTSANVTANLPAGFDLMHTGMICLWYGSSGSVPAGWNICDGTSGTPNLQDKFVLGAGGAFPSSGGATTTSSDSAGSVTVGAYALTVNDLPAHHHALYVDTSTDTDASVLGFTNSSLIGVGGKQYASPGPGGYINVNGGSQQLVQDTGSGTAHTHSGALAGTHSHTALPPYVALFYIMKL